MSDSSVKGDAGALLEYRLRDGALTPFDPRRPFGPLGDSYIVITCPVRGFNPERVRDQPGPDIRRGALTVLAVLAAIAGLTFTLLLIFGV